MCETGRCGIGLEIKMLGNLIKRRIESEKRADFENEVTGINVWVICFLGDHADRDIFQKDLEKEFGITRSTASKVVILMEKKGLVRRESVPQDARLKKLTLTPKSQEMHKHMTAHRRQMEALLTRGFAPEEIEQLHSYLERLCRNVEQKGDTNEHD